MLPGNGVKPQIGGFNSITDEKSSKFSQKPCESFISIIIAQCLWYFLLQSKLFPHVDAMRNRKFFERLPAGYLRCFRQQLLIVHWFHIQWGKVQTSDAVTQEIFAECNDCSLHRAFTKLCIWLIMPHVFWLHGNVFERYGSLELFI